MQPLQFMAFGSPSEMQVEFAAVCSQENSHNSCSIFHALKHVAIVLGPLASLAINIQSSDLKLLSEWPNASKIALQKAIFAMAVWKLFEPITDKLGTCG